MILTNEETEKRLNSPDNLMNKGSGIVVEPLHIRKESGDTSIGNDIKSLFVGIAERTNQKAVADEFDVTARSISVAKKGLVGQRLDTDLKEKTQSVIQKNTERSKELALDALVGTLINIKDTVNEVTDPTKAIKVAVGLAKIAGSFGDNGAKPGTAIMVHIQNVPPERTESQYQTLSV